MSNRTVALLFVILVIAGLVLLGEKKRGRVKVAAVAPNKTETKAPPKEAFYDDALNKMSVLLRSDEDKKEAMEAELGVMGKKLPLDDGKVKLPVTVLPQPTCFRGDLDALGKVLDRNRQKSLILSVEPVLPTDSSVTPQAARVSFQQLTQGGVITDFYLDPNQLGGGDQASQLGVFICTDFNEKGRCNDKQPAAIDTINYDYANRRVAEWNGDRIFHFQYLMMKGQSMTMLRRNGLDQEKYPILADYLKQEAPKSHANPNAVARRVEELNGAINSAGAQISSPGVTLVLPQFTKAACKDVLTAIGQPE